MNQLQTNLENLQEILNKINNLSEATRSDGEIFTGKMVIPWKSYDDLDDTQREYEATIAELDIALLDAQYQSLIGGL